MNQGRNPLPVIVGEKKEDYYLRVAIDKINKNYRLEEQKLIIDNSKKIIKKLCSKRPQIALIPISSKKYTLGASLAVIHGRTKTLKEYLEHQANGNMAWWATHTFFADCLRGIHPSNCSNLVSTGVKVPASELEFVGIPDSFELMQIMAQQRGLKPGEKFDLYTLEKVEEQTATQVATTEQTHKAQSTKTSQEIAQYEQTSINETLNQATPTKQNEKTHEEDRFTL